VNDPEKAFAEPSRQSPLAIVVLAWRALRQISVINIIFILVAVSSGRLPISGVAVILFGLLALAVAGVLGWWRFVFVIDGGELRIDKGVLSQEHLAIPLNRVQTVSLEQGLLHQILGLTQVSVDTAGSSEVEFRFEALDRRRAELLQQVVARHRATSVELVGAPPPTGPKSELPHPLVPPTGSGPVPGPALAPPVAGPLEVLAVRSFGDLVRIGLGSWPWAGLVVIFPLLAVVDELSELTGLDVLGRITNRLENVEANGLGQTVSPGLLIVSILAFVAVATLFGWLFQIIRSMLTNWELTLTRTATATGDGLRRDSGLLNRTTISANLARVQNLRVSQNLIQRLLGIHHLTLHITGETNIQIPGSPAQEVARIAELALPSGQPVLDRQVARSYVLREFRTGVFLAVPVAVLTALALGWWAVLALLIPAQALVAGFLYWRSMRWGFTERRIGYRHGVVNQRWHHLEYIKTQTVSVRQSWFERRRDLATFSIRSAESEFTIPFLDKEEAEALRNMVLVHVESSNRSWM